MIIINIVPFRMQLSNLCNTPFCLITFVRQTDQIYIYIFSFRCKNQNISFYLCSIILCLYIYSFSQCRTMHTNSNCKCSFKISSKYFSGLNTYYERSQDGGAEKYILSEVGGKYYRVGKTKIWRFIMSTSQNISVCRPSTK